MAKRKRKSSGLSAVRTNKDKCSGFDSLPRDIFTDIMLQLSPKSLTSLKILNKSWYFTIRCLTKDPDFIAKHQSLAEARSTMLLINQPPIRQRRNLQNLRNIKHGISKLVPPVPGQKSQLVASTFVTQFIDDGDEEDIHCVTENIYLSHLPDFLIRRRDSDTEVYHCNGVVCLTNDCKTLTVYSPTTGDFETFCPKSEAKLRRNRDGIGNGVIGMGFGSDPGARNFKVVRILDSKVAQVFAPGVTDSWREVRFSVQGIVDQLLRTHLYSKGYCFWLVDWRSDLMLCFDVSREVFHVITLPSEVNNPSSEDTRLSARDCSVCLFWYPYKKPIEVWVLDIEREGQSGDGNFRYSWRKWLRFERFDEGIRCPLSFWRSDKILVLANRRKVVLYDIGTQKHKSISLNEVFGSRCYYFDPYVNSLASINWIMLHIRSLPNE